MSRANSPSPIDRHVGSRVRFRRIEIGMSQERLGEAVGVTFQQIQKYEKGTNRIGASRLQLISGVLGVPVSYFFDGVPTEGGPSRSGVISTQDVLGDAQAMRLLKAYGRLGDPRLQRRVVEMLVSLADAIEGHAAASTEALEARLPS